MKNYFEEFRKLAIYSVIIMIAFVVTLTIISLVQSIYDTLFIQHFSLEDKQDILTFIGNFLVAVIGLELMDTLIIYLREHKLFPELILMVVLAAVAREVLVTDLVHADPLLLMGIGTILIAIAGSYYLIRKAAVMPTKESEVTQTSTGPQPETEEVIRDPAR